jgi:hypothetical protein
MTFKKEFGVVELGEIAHIQELKYIVKNWDNYKNECPVDKESDYEYDPKKLCEKYISNYNKFIKISYHKSKNYTSKLGRWFAKNGVGIQTFPRKIRHTICKGLYIDLDFKNCHPVILSTLCKNNNIECPYLNNYIENREILLAKWSNDLDISKDECKINFLAMLNGNKTIYDIDNWVDMMMEFENIHKSISALPIYENIYEEVRKNEIKNIFAKTINRILCDIENKCLVELYTIFKNKNMLYVEIDGVAHIICAIIFDGLQIPDNEYNRERTTPEWLAKYSAIIENNTGYNLEITIKPFNELLNIPENFESDLNNDDEIIIKDDGDACDAIISKYGDKMLTCCNNKYIKNGNIWTDDTETISGIIYNWIYETPIKKEVGKNYVYYNRDETSINKCSKMVKKMGFKTNDNFLKDNQDASIKYLPFKNGVYSFVDKKLYKYNEVNVQFTQFINRDFPTYNESDLFTLMEKVIIPIYPDEEERKYMMYSLARILAGHYKDKKWYINKGSRNCGKGVITILLQNAFNSYVGTFHAGTFITKTNKVNDEDANLLWAICARNKRLLISNEIDENATLNGALIKKFASGGDKMTARPLYGSPTEFVPQFSLMFMCNEIKDPDPIDTLDNCVQFLYKSKFVEQEDLIPDVPFLKLADENIKDMLKQNNIIDAFTLYILDHYGSNMKMPDCVKRSCAVLKEDKPITLIDIITKHFRHSANNDHKMLTQDIISNIINCGYTNNINFKQLASTFAQCKIGIKTDNNISVGDKRGKGYTNIIYIAPVKNDDDDDDDDDDE